MLSRCVRCLGGKVGFIGLGQMGGRMAPNLIKNGYSLVVADTVQTSVDAAKGHGAQIASTPREVAEQCDTIITMLPNTAAVKAVYEDSNTGILSALQKNTLLIDCSTIDPQTPKNISGQVEAKGGRFVDAPVSGGIMAAQNAALTFLVGGTKANADAATVFLNHMGKNVIHCGEAVGSGQVVKICNNLMLAISMCGVSEVMMLGSKLGVDPKLLAQAMNVSSGRCWAGEIYNPFPGVVETAPSSKGYQGGFAVKLMNKDLGLAVDAADSVGFKLNIGQNAADTYKTIMEGYGDLDFSAVFKHLQDTQ